MEALVAKEVWQPLNCEQPRPKLGRFLFRLQVGFRLFGLPWEDNWNQLHQQEECRFPYGYWRFGSTVGQTNDTPAHVAQRILASKSYSASPSR